MILNGREVRPGDRVVIRPDLTKDVPNTNSSMAQYAGETFTVKRLNDAGYCRLEGASWSWGPQHLKGFADDEFDFDNPPPAE
jgi:membrane protein implicated in regulation of membrane protease activity